MVPVIQRSMVAGVMLVGACAVHATHINYNGFSLDDTRAIVTGDGLEWLQYGQTVGLSLNDAPAAVAGLYGGGWTVATNAQMAAVFNAFQFDDTLYTGAEADWQSSGSADFRGAEGAGPYAMYLELFGRTYVDGAAQTGADGGLEHAIWVYGDDLNGNGFYGLGSVVGDYDTSSGGSGVRFVDSFAYMAGDLVPGGYADSGFGVALVRAARTDPTPVTEPSAIALMLIGLLGLGAARRQQKKEQSHPNPLCTNTASA